jgi:hypothetical protein
VLLEGFRITAPAALEIAPGALTGDCYFRHSREQFLAFLNTLGEALTAPAIAPCPGQLFHHSTHQVKRRLERHMRVHFHFTLTGASSMTSSRSGSQCSPNTKPVAGLPIRPRTNGRDRALIEGYNAWAQPFLWTNTADEILSEASKQ